MNGNKVDKSKCGGYQNPPFKFPVVSEVNSLGDSKQFRRLLHMSTLNTASQVINTLVEATKLPMNYVENGASLWVFSLKDLIAKARKQGSGTTLVTKGGYITTRQNKESISSLPFFQSMEVETFGCIVKEGKVAAAHSDLIWKDNGHEYAYNTKLQFSVKLCQQICLAALGEQGIKALFTSQLEEAPTANPVDLLMGITSPAVWWNKLQRVLLSSDLQIQLLVVVDAKKIQDKVVSKVYGTTDQYCFDFDVTEHVKGFQVVSSVNSQYIWGLGLPQETIQLVSVREEREVKFYKSVDEIALTSKNAETQLKKFFVTFLEDHEEYYANQEAGRLKFLNSGIKEGSKLHTWLQVEGNKEKAVIWLSKRAFTPKNAVKKVDDFDKKSDAKAEVQDKIGGDTMDIILPVVEKKSTLASTFASDEGDDNWGIEAE